MEKRKRVAIYARVSTLDQSTSNQREELTAYAKNRGWEIYRVYEEKLSGASDKRPEFQRMMADARQRRFDVCLCLKLDRMYRSTKGMLQTLEEFNELGVEFVSLRDQIDLTTATGKLMAMLLSAVAEFERSLILERVKTGIIHAKAKGVRFGRPVSRDDGRIRALRSQGKSYRQIAKQLGVSTGAVQRSLQGVTKVSASA